MESSERNSKSRKENEQTVLPKDFFKAQLAVDSLSAIIVGAGIVFISLVFGQHLEYPVWIAGIFLVLVSISVGSFFYSPKGRALSGTKGVYASFLVTFLLDTSFFVFTVLFVHPAGVSEYSSDGASWFVILLTLLIMISAYFSREMIKHLFDTSDVNS